MLTHATDLAKYFQVHLFEPDASVKLMSEITGLCYESGLEILAINVEWWQGHRLTLCCQHPLQPTYHLYVVSQSTHPWVLRIYYRSPQTCAQQYDIVTWQDVHQKFVEFLNTSKQTT